MGGSKKKSHCIEIASRGLWDCPRRAGELGVGVRSSLEEPWTWRTPLSLQSSVPEVRQPGCTLAPPGGGCVLELNYA